jgi:hypothetical protein
MIWRLRQLESDFFENYFAIHFLPFFVVVGFFLIVGGIFLSEDLIYRIMYIIIGIPMLIIGLYAGKKWFDSI